MRPLRFVPLIFSLSACSSLTPICDPHAARELGTSLALRGLPPDYRAGQTCPGGDFRQNLDLGYAEGKAAYCRQEDVEKRALAAGEAGEDLKFDETHYHLCDNRDVLRRAHRRAMAQGRAKVCTSERAAESGKAYGGVGRAPEFPSSWEHACHSTQIDELKQAYLAAYHQSLLDYCQGKGIENKAESDGAQGLAPYDPQRNFGECPVEQREKLKTVVGEAYRRGLGKYCDPDTLTHEAAFRAQRGADSELPATYVVCQPYFPDFQTRYEKLFHDARAHVVDQECTYPAGEKRGQADAGAGNAKKTEMPAVCDGEHFPSYLSGYLDGWKAKKEGFCDKAAAYEQGRGDAHRGSPARFTSPPLCPDEYGPTLVQAYRQGYDLMRVEEELNR